MDMLFPVEAVVTGGWSGAGAGDERTKLGGCVATGAGVVLSGDAVIDQQSLTGAAMPVAGRVGTQVYASTLARSGQIHIRAERVGRNTRAAAGLELLRQAPAILSMTNDT